MSSLHSERQLLKRTRSGRIVSGLLRLLLLLVLSPVVLFLSWLILLLVFTLAIALTIFELCGQIIKTRLRSFLRRQGSTGKKTSRSEEHTSELQSLMRISYAVFCLKKKKLLSLHHHLRSPHYDPTPTH